VHILWWLAVKFRQSDIVAGLKEFYCSNLAYSSIRSQSVKFPNFWISASKWRWSEVRWLCCIAVTFLSECHKLDHSRFLSHCTVSIRVNVSCLLGEFFSNYEYVIFHEQHVCVKFCFKLGKTFSETFETLKQVFGDDTMSITQPLSGTNVLKSAKLQLRTMNVQDDLQHQKMKKT